MIGASRNSLALVQESMRSRSNQGDLSALSAELLAAADILANEKSLRQNLADSGQPISARTSLIKDLFGKKVSASTNEFLGELVAARWSSGEDLVDAVELVGFQALTWFQEIQFRRSGGWLAKCEQPLTQVRYGQLFRRLQERSS